MPGPVVALDDGEAGAVPLHTVTISVNSSVIGKQLVNLGLPGVSTVLNAGDQLHLLADEEATAEVRRLAANKPLTKA